MDPNFCLDVLRHRIMVAEFVARHAPPSSQEMMNGGQSMYEPVRDSPVSSPNPDSNASEHYGPDGYNNNSNLSNAEMLKRKEIFNQRKQREFIPDNKKDDSYWDRRRRNNEAAKRSREKRRFNDMILEQRVVELTKENHVLKAQLAAVKDKFGPQADNLISMDQVMATVPPPELSVKRAKVSPPRPHPTSVIHEPVSSAYPQSESAFAPPEPHQHPHHHEYAPNVSPVYPYAMHLAHPLALSTAAIASLDGSSALNLSRSRSPVSSPAESSDEGILVSRSPPADYSSLPLKLRHKRGEKDAASTLLALQAIKQEARASPPWDAEGSSDERDSGISIGAEWPAQTQPALQRRDASPAPPDESLECENSQLKSQLARLASEVANLKTILTRKVDEGVGHQTGASL
ncbi:nuclear factor interleukin-3-regulated protein isoform X2 [Neocloeon triangulifer]|uniref:nuclear factor interleukin-3-regulated protein isoform X2 n=1 Tax=Neocloeon triangulifer TaxID=2078957 RepID=UPI00286F24DF|nr:nuclear factor interleukin-3-regulated protein isoform X2 [Neocloeon triangulifer]